MTDQSTGGVDQPTETRRDPVLYADQPARQKEIAQLKRLKVFSLLWLVLAAVATLTGLNLLGRFVPVPIMLVLAVLWCIAAWGQAFGVGKLIDKQRINSDHYWQDKLDTIFKDLIAGIEESAARSAKWDQDSAQRQAERAAQLAEIKALVGEAQTHTPERPRRGRPEVTAAEAITWIDKADWAVVAILARTGQRPTREAIAAEIGLSTSTLGRYEKIAGRKVSVNK